MALCDGMNLLEAALRASVKSAFIPTDGPQSRAGAGYVWGIVIPVVVGSSPISHPSIHAARSPSACNFVQRLIPTVGILAQNLHPSRSLI